MTGYTYLLMVISISLEGSNGKFLIEHFKILLSQIHELNLGEQKLKLKQVFEEWRGDRQQTDDILVVGVKI